MQRGWSVDRKSRQQVTYREGGGGTRGDSRGKEEMCPAKKGKADLSDCREGAILGACGEVGEGGGPGGLTWSEAMVARCCCCRFSACSRYS